MLKKSVTIDLFLTPQEQVKEGEVREGRSKERRAGVELIIGERTKSLAEAFMAKRQGFIDK